MIWRLVRLYQALIDTNYELRANRWHRAKLEFREKLGRWFNGQRDIFWKTLKWDEFLCGEGKKIIIWQMVKLKANHKLDWWRWSQKNATS